jgi:outer membrane immunogenic protein
MTTAAVRSPLRSPRHGRRWPKIPTAVSKRYVGVNAGGTWSSNNHITINTVPPTTTTLMASSRVDYLGTVRGRVGYLVAPFFLAYANGGLAYGKISGSAGFATTNADFPSVFLTETWGTAGSISSTRIGWTAGGGFEWMLVNSWSVKGEYLYYDLGSVIHSLGVSGSVVLPGPPQAGTLWFTNTSSASQRFTGNIVRVGLNYKFGSTAVPAIYK